MFEQESQRSAPVVRTQEGDLFHNYEIRHWHHGRHSYKVLIASTIITFSTLLLIAQTDLLTRSGCDSPWVGSVCQVLDMTYVGTVLYGTESEYVDQAYEEINLDDSEITFIDVSGETPPITYPEGYFQIANPVQYAELVAAQQNATSGYTVPTPYPSTGSMMGKAPVYPKYNPNTVTGPIPDSPFPTNDTNTNTSPSSKGKNNTSNVVDTNGTSNTEAVPPPLSSEAVDAVVINKQPLTDFADGVALKWASKQIDLAQDVTVVLNGVIATDGKLDKNKSKFDPTRQKGDPQMVDVAKSAFEALGASGFLFYLKAAGIEKFTATLTQDNENLSIVISSPQRSEERAKSVASLVGVAITGGKVKAQNPSDERTLLDAAKLTYDGKNTVLNFTIPKQVAHEMINRKLQEAQAKKSESQKPNSVSARTGSDNTAPK